MGLFLRGARTDARLNRLRDTFDNRQAFEALYTESPDADPWASADLRYQYQRRKYEAITQMVPPRSYARGLDVGCGTGLLTELLAPSCGEILGIDISQHALQHAATRTSGLKNVRFQQSDVRSLDPALTGRFDLVVVADTLYYLPEPIDDATLRGVADGLAAVLTRDGVLMLINHYFPLPIASTRLTRRIHAAFGSAAQLQSTARFVRAFYLTEVFVVR